MLLLSITKSPNSNKLICFLNSLPCSNVDVESALSQMKHLLNDRKNCTTTELISIALKIFAFSMDEKSFEDRCAAYWERYLYDLADSTDGMLLFEKANLNVLRQSWINKDFSIKCLRKSKRFVSNESVIETV
ncbi:unnamed protein product, partial [Rotaria sp. Silwood2]